MMIFIFSVLVSGTQLNGIAVVCKFICDFFCTQNIPTELFMILLILNEAIRHYLFGLNNIIVFA